MPTIREYTIADLRGLLASRDWFLADPLPMTRQRALSQVNNPRAEPSDVVLLVAYEAHSVVAYLGILPDTAFVKRGAQKIGWMTTWWSNPDRKFAGLGAMLLMRALKLYPGGLGGSGFSSDSKRVFAALKKFVTVSERRGLTGFASLDLAERLPRKWPVLSSFTWLLAVCDCTIHTSSLLRQFAWRRSHVIPSGVRIEYFTEFDAEAQDYIARHHCNELTRRTARELNWIVQYPWLLAAPVATPVPYYFSSYIHSYSISNIKVFDTSDTLVALMTLIAIDGHLIVPYCYHDNQAELCARIIGGHLVKGRLKALTSYRSDVLDAFAALRFPWAWTKPRSRAWVMAGACAIDGFEGYSLQDGDGDLAWTL